MTPEQKQRAKDAIAMILKAAGWRDTCDAQWAGIEAALPELREILAAAPVAPEQDGLARDAERYRWLRAYNTAKHPAVTEAFFLGDENLDAAIDAAIAAEKEINNG